MKSKDNLTVVTSIPRCYSNQEFFETTGLFINSVRRFHADIEIIVVVPTDYNITYVEKGVSFIKHDLDTPELLMSNVVAFVQDYIKTLYFVYFTTENLLLKPLPDISDKVYATITPIVKGNSYFEYERSLHKLYTGENNNNDNMVLEYVIAGRTHNSIWNRFYNQSVEILNFIKDNRSDVEQLFDSSLWQYILPSADLVSINLLYVELTNIEHSFISMHPGLSELYIPPTNDSIFYQYSGLYHHNVNKIRDIPSKNTKCWIAKQFIGRDIDVKLLEYCKVHD